MFTKKQKTTIILCFCAIVGVLFAKSWILDVHTTSTPDKPAAPIRVPRQLYSGLDDPNPSKTIVVLAYEWPPFNYKDEKGAYLGADTEITRIVLKRMGYKVRFVDMPFARILEEMRNGAYPAVLPCVDDGDRRDFLYFSEPVSAIYSVLWKLKHHDFSWESYADLRGFRIGASYYEYGAGFVDAAKKHHFTLDMVGHKTPELIHFRKLMEEKIDLFICELSVGKFIQREYAPEFDSVDFCSKGVGPLRPFSFALSKKFFEGREEEAVEFIKRFNKELSAFSAEGKHKRIFAKYDMRMPLDANGMVKIPESDSPAP